jgi:hypothetical protein
MGGDIGWGIQVSNAGGSPALYLAGEGGGDVDTGDQTLTLPGGGGTVLVVKTALDYGAISGRLYADMNNNGTYDAGEAPLRGWTVYLDANGNGVLDAGEPTALTGNAGEYQFAHLPSGSYPVRQVRPAGWTQTAPATPSYAVSLATDQFANGRDFGNYSPATTNTYSASPRAPIAYNSSGTPTTSAVTVGTSATVYAAGWSWFVDRTPRRDSEFHRPGDQGEQQHMDLLTVLTRELGHVLGLDHTEDCVMAEYLAAGTRFMPVSGAMDSSLVGWLAAEAFTRIGKHTW